MSPTKPLTMRERFGGGRKDYDRQYNRTARNSAIERMRSSKRWAQVRGMIRNREPLCRRCRARGFARRWDQLHHIRPVATHPELFFDLCNIEPLCFKCHAAQSQQERASG